MRRLFLLGVFGALGACTPTSADRCLSDADCAADARCVRAPDAEAPACAAICDAQRPCASGTACMASIGDVAVCLPLGEDRPDGAPCDSDLECASGACEGEGADRLCRALCTTPDDCEGDLGCFLVGVRKVCLSVIDSREAGADCETPRQCASGHCVALYGQDRNVCAAPCAGGEGCQSDQRCVRLEVGAEVCIDQSANGSPCLNAELCLGGACVRDRDGTALCTEPCAPDGGCTDPTWTCIKDSEGTDVCMPPLDTRAAGEACEFDRECASKRCIDFGPFGLQCAVPCATGCGAQEVCWTVETGEEVCGPS